MTVMFFKGATYSSEGKFVLLNDFNARTANKDDFNFNDLQEIAECTFHHMYNNIFFRSNFYEPIPIIPLMAIWEIQNLSKSDGLQILNGIHKLNYRTVFSFIVWDSI